MWRTGGPKGREHRAERHLIRSDDMRHWTWRARRQRARRQISVVTLGIRERTDQARQGGRVLLALAGRVLLGMVAAVVLVVAVEALATWLNHFLHWGSLFKPVMDTSYDTFVGAAVGAQATFLALFFTTVGVIASTAYARVPGEIRQLFVRERTTTIYVWNVVLALVVGIVLLAFPVVSSHQFRGLTVTIFALLSIFSVLSLVILGRRLFNFFDPSALSERLYPEFARAVRGASAAGKHVPDEAEQKAAHKRAATVLRRYGQLVIMISAREIQDSTAPQKIAYQLLGCWAMSATFKSSIPVKSEWFHRTASHPNWLTMEHHQLSTALETRTGVQPTLAPDPLWVERRFSSLLGALLPNLASNDDWGRLISVLDSANELIFNLAKRLQIDEALLLLSTIGAYRETQAATPEDHVPSDDSKLLRLALAEREVLGFTSLWLGLVRPFEFLNPQSLGTSLDTAVASTSNAYKAGAPRDLLSLLEVVARGIEYEEKVEHQRVTPDWWVHHVCARVYAATFKETVCSFIEHVETTLITPLVNDANVDPELAAVRIFDLLELLHKIEFHLRTVHAALDAFQTLRHDPTADELWPDTTLPDDKPGALEEQLLVKLGSAAIHLPSTPHDESKLDLFGQAYRRLFDGTFHAILEGRDDLARQLFPITIAIADRARERLTHDLAEYRVRQQAIFGTEPLVDMMELSGYALLMSLVTGAGIWPDVRTVWDAILEASVAPQLAAQLTAVLSLQENVFAITSGGVGRTSRQMELSRVLTEQGIVGQTHMWGELHVEPHPDPVVATFAPDSLMGVHHDLADLFIVEYLAERPELSGLEIPRGAEMLRESIEHQRRRNGPPDDDETGDDDAT